MIFWKEIRKEWGLAKHTFIDSADAATITELNKFKREHAQCLYVFNAAYKAVKIIDRIILQLGWMNFNDNKDIQPSFLIVENCKEYVRNWKSILGRKKRIRNRKMENDHMVNSVQYNWIPYRKKIGVIKE